MNNNVETNVPVEYQETLNVVKAKATASNSWTSQPPTLPTTPEPVAPTLPNMEVIV